MTENRLRELIQKHEIFLKELHDKVRRKGKTLKPVVSPKKPSKMREIFDSIAGDIEKHLESC